MKGRALERLRAQAGAAVELFGWWRAELRDIAQWLLRQLPSRKSPELMLRVAPTAASLEQREAQGWKVVGTLPRGEDGSWPAELPGLPPELHGARTALVFPVSEFYFDEIDLPLAAERHLTSVLRLQLERRLPVPLEQLLVDHQVVARDKRRETLCVRTAVAHREPVENLRESAVRWGLTPIAAGVESADGVLQFNLLRRRRDPIRWSPTPLDRRLLRAAAVGIAVFCAVTGVQWMRERATVNGETVELHAQAQELAAQRVALVAQAAPLQALRAVAASPSAPELLAKMSAVVPNTAWFTHIDLAMPVGAPGSIKLTGTVESEEGIVTVLRTVPGLRNLRTSSAFAGEILGRNRVEISAEYQAPDAKVEAL